MMNNLGSTLIDSWQPFIKATLESAVIVGLGAIVHELGHYVAVKAGGGEVIRFEFDPLTLTITMFATLPESAQRLSRLSGGLVQAGYYALLSMTDRNLLVPAALSLGYSFSEMEYNPIVMAVFGFLTTLSVLDAQLRGILEGELS